MKTVLLGVTGCIAAYKACEIVRGVQKADPSVNVKIVMTDHATRFVGPTTFRALTGNEVAVDLFDDASDPIHHISLAREADVFCIAPATANVIAKIANGLGDDLLTTTAIATRAPLLVAPGMNDKMWADAQTQENIGHLRARGARVITPGSGYLACGTEGAGRMEDPEVIVSEIMRALEYPHDLEGRCVLVTAGPTQEPIDPVRFISNHSSGRQGYAIAAEAAARGAQVTLVSGPTGLIPPEDVEFVRVQTADEMLEACRAPFASADLAVFVAAVSDWKAAHVSSQKLKRGEGGLEVEFVANPDIAATLSADKGDTRVVVFAAETGDPLEAARRKLASKNADLCVANDVSDPKLGMGTADNHVWFVDGTGAQELPTMDKRSVARALLDRVSEAL